RCIEQPWMRADARDEGISTRKPQLAERLAFAAPCGLQRLERRAVVESDIAHALLICIDVDADRAARTRSVQFTCRRCMLAHEAPARMARPLVNTVARTAEHLERGRTIAFRRHDQLHIAR